MSTEERERANTRRLREQPRRLGAVLGIILTLIPAVALGFQLVQKDSLDEIDSAASNASRAMAARQAAAGAAIALWAYRATELDAYASAFQERLDSAADSIPFIDGVAADGLLGDLSAYRKAGGTVISEISQGDDVSDEHEALDEAYDTLVNHLTAVIDASVNRTDAALGRSSNFTSFLVFAIAGGVVLAAVLVFGIVGTAVRSTTRIGQEEAARREAEARQGESESALELERQARERLEEAERLQREFVGIVSHEFRTPLTSITGFISVLKERWDVLSPAEREEFLGIVDRQSKRLSRLVEDLLLAGKIQEQRVGVVLERIDVRQLLRETIEEEQPKAGSRKLAATVEPGAEYIVSDELRLRQILVNLLDNSIKYSPEGSPITLRCTRDERDIILSCEDEGPGIPKDKAEHLLEKFTQGDASETRRVGGVGLGLYIVRNLASAIGGEIALAERGKGMYLEVRLPQRRKTDAIVAAGGPLFDETEPGDGTDEMLQRWTSGDLTVYPDTPSSV
jgi:signal transduction histidine kinase